MLTSKENNMENVFIKTAKTIYENEGDCIDINRCEDCPLDDVCDLYTTDKIRFKYTKEILEEKGIELPVIKPKSSITKTEMIELYTNGIRISYDKQKNIEVTKENNSIIIKLPEE